MSLLRLLASDWCWSPFGDDLLTENWRGERKQFRRCLVATSHFSPTLVSAQMQSGGTQAGQHSYLASQKQMSAKNIAKIFPEKVSVGTLL